MQLLWLLVIATLSAQSFANNYYYRFTIKGKTVILDSIPSEYAPLGYEVLNANGNPVKVVPRQLTQEEIIERDRERSSRKAYEARVARQREEDIQLLRSYASEQDIQRSFQRKKEELEINIQHQRLNLSDLYEKLAKSQQRAIEFEEQDMTVPQHILKNIENRQDLVSTLEKSVRSKELALESLEADYEKIRYRFLVLQHYPWGTLSEEVDASLVSPP